MKHCPVTLLLTCPGGGAEWLLAACSGTSWQCILLIMSATSDMALLGI